MAKERETEKKKKKGERKDTEGSKTSRTRGLKRDSRRPESAEGTGLLRASNHLQAGIVQERFSFLEALLGGCRGNQHSSKQNAQKRETRNEKLGPARGFYPVNMNRSWFLLRTGQRDRRTPIWGF